MLLVFNIHIRQKGTINMQLTLRSLENVIITIIDRRPNAATTQYTTQFLT